VISFNCKCGEALQMEESQAGTWVQCPACGVVMTVPSESEPISMKPVSTPQGSVRAPRAESMPSPMDNFAAVPTSIPENLRSPGNPPCYLMLITRGAVVSEAFDVLPVMEALAQAFAKKMRSRYDVQIVSKAPESAPSAVIRLARIDEGNQFLRYFLTFLAGKTVLEVTGNVRSASGTQVTIHETHKGMAGLMGGSSKSLIKASAKYLGTKIAKKALK
jgi:hypothetical protein